jgi:hypothetical protein
MPFIPEESLEFINYFATGGGIITLVIMGMMALDL